MLLYLRRLILALLTLLAGPLLLLLGVTLLFFNLVHLLTRFTRQRAPSQGPRLSGLASIIILNWNGRDLLEQCIPSVVEAVKADGREHEVIVVDNGSTDDSGRYVRENYPQVRLVEIPENVGFAEGNNIGVGAATHDVVILLNNDMTVDRGFLRPLLNGFGPSTFAVSSQIFLQDPAARREETGKTLAVFRRGMIDYSHAPLDGRHLRRPLYPVFWAGGGSSAFHRERFLSLGGFQEVYSPAYVEDADLSYQAWRVGWEVLLAPASVVYHRHRASSVQRFSRHELEVLVQRNQFIFIWKNIRSWRLLASHCMHLPWTCYRLARDYGIGIWRSLAQAAIRIPSLQIARLSAPFRGARTDREIFSLLENPGLYFANSALSGRAISDPGDSRPRILWMTAYLPHCGRHAGAGRMFQLLQRMAGRYRITLLSFLETDDEQEFVPELDRLCERVVTMRRHPPFRWQLFPYEPFDEFLTPEMEAALRESLENYDYSLVHLEYTQMASYAERARGVPVVLTKHEVDFAACLRRCQMETKPLLKLRWFYNYLQVLDREITLQRHVDLTVCMIDDDARMLARFGGGNRIRVINTGVDLEYFRPLATAPTEPRMVFVGAFQHLPNVEAMVYFCRAVLPLIRKQVPDASLTIVGSKPTPEILDLSEIPGVEVTGYVPDIRPFMASASVYVVPLRLGVGIRGKILEAWGMAMAVVATPVACAGLRYRDGGNILVAGDTKSFAEKTVSLLRNPLLRAQLGTEGRRVVEEHYGWDAAALQLDSLYREIALKGNRDKLRAEEMGVTSGK